ncbi:hypothetical protein P7K49_019581 [Saguinus oedipus]|uniref:PPM-type phosphatase domain-containing protein n=1 Tax=Saguinus oedipus TaxID=9490 RepID=A0ABQ9UXS9_SAGOE|nr:hypothetical protein P7K49_019581 [Saguinus oedipus]
MSGIPPVSTLKKEIEECVLTTVNPSGGRSLWKHIFHILATMIPERTLVTKDYKSNLTLDLPTTPSTSPFLSLPESEGEKAFDTRPCTIQHYPCFLLQDLQIERERSSYNISGGCTALIVICLLGKLYVANAGDSRSVDFKSMYVAFACKSLPSIWKYAKIRYAYPMAAVPLCQGFEQLQNRNLQSSGALQTH